MTIPSTNKFMTFSAYLLLSTSFIVHNAEAAQNISSFTDLQTAITNGGDYVFTGNIDGANSNLNTLGGNLTIDGKGFGINSTGNPQGLKIALGKTVSLKNIGTKGQSSWNGFAHNIINSGSLSLNNIIFQNNKTEENGMINGGVVRNEGYISEMSNVIMDNNKATGVNYVLWGGLVMNGTYNPNSLNIVTDKISNSTFSNNTFYAGSTSSNVGAPHGGVLLNIYATINTIDNVLFENNSMTSAPDNSGGAHGTAIDNNEGGVIGTISNATFRNNSTYRTGTATFPAGTNYHSSAGALDNYGTIGLIKNSLFEGNFAETESASASAGSGAIMSVYLNAGNQGYIGSIEDSKFINNHTYAKNGIAYGGAMSLANTGSMKNILFEGNYAKSDMEFARGGAYNQGTGTMGNLTNITFKNNWVSGKNAQSAGGALYNSNNGTIGDLTDVSFLNNYVYSSSFNALGGAVGTGGIMGKLTKVMFSGNYVKVDVDHARGGAMFATNTVGGMKNVTFLNNYAKGGTYAHGGAIYINAGTVGDIVNSTFVGNYVEGGASSAGGAIYSKVNLSVKAYSGNTLFSGNKVNGLSNAIYMAGVSGTPINLNLTAEDGNVTIKDGIDGAFYNINVSGNANGVVELLGDVKGAGELNLQDTTLHIGLNTLNVSKYTSSNTNPGFLKIDVNPDNLTSGLINVSGDVVGNTRLIVNTLSSGKISSSEYIKFLEAVNDNIGTASNFTVHRVIGSPYMWDATLNANGETVGSTWYLSMLGTPNPDYDGVVAPETLTYIGLHSAAINQTKGIASNVKNNAASADYYRKKCRSYFEGGKQCASTYNIWINPIYYKSESENYINIDSEVSGVELGFDVQSGFASRVGAFLTYREGEHEFDGKAEKFYSNIASNIDANSYIGGVYYNYDNTTLWGFASLYGGFQDVDIKTKDGIKSSTEGTLVGAEASLGYTFSFDNNITILPAVRGSYNQIFFDDVEDSVGKTAKYDDIGQFEAEASVKLEKKFGSNLLSSKVYVKPSVIRTFTINDNVEITGMDKITTYKDAPVLGRGEIGMNLQLLDGFSLYALGNYTFGNDYKAGYAGAGLTIAW